MALIQCEDCGREVSTKAAACPHCGCPVPSEAAVPVPPPIPTAASAPVLPEAWTQTQPAAAPRVAVPLKQDRTLEKRVFLVLGAVIVLVILIGIFSGNDSDEATTPTASASSSAGVEAQPAADAAQAAANETSAPAAPAAPPEPPSAWSYSADKDDLGDKTVHTAIVTSTNTIDLDFPYAGPQHGTLMIRRHPRHGRDVVLSIERGQILCHSYGDCPVLVRIDDGPIQRLTGTEPADNSTETVFIPIYQTFLKKLPGAKKVRIQVNIYQSGAPTFEFDVSGFDPKKLSAS